MNTSRRSFLRTSGMAIAASGMGLSCSGEKKSDCSSQKP